MMAERTLVLVTDFDLFKAGEKDREEYIRLLGDLPDYVCLVFVYDLIPYKGDARTKLAGAIRQNGVVVNFARQDQGIWWTGCAGGSGPWGRTSTPVWPWT